MAIVVLRPPQAENFLAWVAFSADEETMRYLGGVQSASGAWRGFCTVAGAWSVRGFSMFSVIENPTGRWVGRIGPWLPEDWPGTEVGWGLAREVWGRGYATEGARATIDYAFDVLRWTEVIHCIEPLNAPSSALAVRLGATRLRQARLPAPFEHVVLDIWGQSCEQWRDAARADVDATRSLGRRPVTEIGHRGAIGCRFSNTRQRTAHGGIRAIR